MNEKLRHPVNFVIPNDNAIWPEIRSGNLQSICEEKLEKYSVGSLNGWVIRTYFHLALKGNDISLSRTPNDKAINIVSPRDFGRRQRGIQPFILVPRADGHRPELANFYLEQNEVLPPGPNRDNVAYWPQPNIKARKHNQRNGFATVGFKGRTLNIDADFRSKLFADKLAGLGVSLELDGFDGLLGHHSWGAYSDLDAILAVRNLTIQDARHKPASKLINAWFGEVPAILGPEPAFQALRRSELDYIEVTSPEEAIAAIERLKNYPDFFWRMVENGRHRRESYTTDAIAKKWVSLLNGPVGDSFERWKSLSAPKQFIVWTRMMIKEPRSKQIYKKGITEGQRLLYPK